MFGLQHKTNDAGSISQEKTYLPAVDVSEDEAGYTILADVPGADKNSVQVTYENGIVTLKAQATAEKTEANARELHREFSLGSYERAFKVGDDVDTENISAEIANGELRVRLPRKASNKKKIAVTIK